MIGTWDCVLHLLVQTVTTLFLQIPWAVFFVAKRDTCPNVNFVWKNDMAGGVLKRDKMSGMSETEGEVEYNAF